MNTEATLLTGKVETPKRALALQLGLAVCGLTALVAALATPRASGPQATGLRGAADANLATFTSHATVDPSGGPLIEVLRTDRTSEQNIVKTIENGVSLEISETADAICGCDLQTCCDNGFNGRNLVGPLQCDILRNSWEPEWGKPFVDFCREVAEGKRNGSSSACEQPEVFDTWRMGITYMIEWDKTCAQLDEPGYCNKDGMECSGPGTRPFNATCPQGISNPFNLAGPGSHTCMRATHSARAFPLDQIYQISFSHEWGYRDGSRVDVFLVKMRYPSSDTPCQPLISPDEVRRGESSYEVTQVLNPETYKVPDAPQRSINGLCCDCCHGCCAKGPCGRFPFLGVGNQFLTPLQYANLARLGHELAAEPLAQLVEARAAATRRKSSPAAALITRKRAEAPECADCPLLSSRF